MNMLLKVEVCDTDGSNSASEGDSIRRKRGQSGYMPSSFTSFEWPAKDVVQSAGHENNIGKRNC